MCLFLHAAILRLSDMQRECITGFTISALLKLVCAILGQLRNTEAGFQAIFASFCDIAQFPVVFPMRIKQFILIIEFIHRCGPRLLDSQVFSYKKKKVKGLN